MGNKRLLVCDNEPAFGRFVKNVAEDLGYEVEVTTAWQAFMQAYLTFSPTTIVLDIVMPGMDGIELLCGWEISDHRRASSSSRATRLTTRRTQKILAEYKGLGPVTTLHKPIEKSELRAALLAHHRPSGPPRERLGLTRSSLPFFSEQPTLRPLNCPIVPPERLMIAHTHTDATKIRREPDISSEAAKLASGIAVFRPAVHKGRARSARSGSQAAATRQKTGWALCWITRSGIPYPNLGSQRLRHLL